MNIKYECDKKVENVSITNYEFYKNGIYNERITKVINNIMDIRTMITEVYGVDTIRLIIDVLGYKIKMEVVFKYIDEDRNEHIIEMMFDDNKVHIDLDTYAQNEKLIKDIKKRYKKILKLLK